MDLIMKIVKIDIISIRPYLTIKNLIIFISLGIFYAFVSRNPTFGFSMVPIFSILFSSYPFLVGDESGIDSLYRIFGIDEKKVVYGRYITAIMIVLVNAILGSILFVAISLMIKSDELFMSLSINFLTTSFISIFIIILQYPSYFKYGYTKAKTMVLRPFLIMGILIFIGVSFKKQVSFLLGKVSENPLLVITGILILFVFIFIMSMYFSKKWYVERDF